MSSDTVPIRRLRLSDGRSFPAQLIGGDSRADLALLKIDAPNLVPAEMADSASLEMGEWVIAVGNPLGYSNTVSVGVVSNLNRSLPTGRDSWLVDSIQTDAAINSGNSGGALANTKGQVVGINSAIATNTGGSVGIGFAIPSNRVKRVVDEITAAGGTAHGIPADLTRDEESRRIVWDTVSRFKGLDFVWNHVGHPGPAAVEGIDMNAFDLAVDLNLRTVLVTTEAAIPEMRRRGGGSLLFTASTSGLQGSSYSPVYSMCKFGVVGFVKSLSVRLAPEKIRVNALCPGPLRTELLMKFLDTEAKLQRRLVHIPIGRFGEAKEIAQAALFLASDESSFMNGAEFIIDGGITAAYVTPE